MPATSIISSARHIKGNGNDLKDNPGLLRKVVCDHNSSLFTC